MEASKQARRQKSTVLGIEPERLWASRESEEYVPYLETVSEDESGYARSGLIYLEHASAFSLSSTASFAHVLHADPSSPIFACCVLVRARELLTDIHELHL